MKLHLAWPVSVATVALVLAGCSSSDADSTQRAAPRVRQHLDIRGGGAQPGLQKAADDYKEYAVTEVDKLVGARQDLHRRGARGRSEGSPGRIRPVARAVGAHRAARRARLRHRRPIDSRVDDFTGVDDPKFTGWHRLEYLLFEKNTTEGGAPFADQLDAGIAQLKTEIAGLTVEPINVANGAAELIEEVSQGKITGEEERYSKTDLWDFDANLQGSQAAVDPADAGAEGRRRRSARQDQRRVHRALRHHGAAAQG